MRSRLFVCLFVVCVWVCVCVCARARARLCVPVSARRADSRTNQHGSFAVSHFEEARDAGEAQRCAEKPRILLDLCEARRGQMKISCSTDGCLTVRFLCERQAGLVHADGEGRGDASVELVDLPPVTIVL